jgi:hypothetical protein
MFYSGRKEMAAGLLERVTEIAPFEAGVNRQALVALVEKLEGWLPSEEARLQAAREQDGADYEHETRWMSMLRLYERLCVAVRGTAA